jgi:hypothetical protein
MTLLSDAADRGGYLVLDDSADPTGRLVPTDGLGRCGPFVSTVFSASPGERLLNATR